MTTAQASEMFDLRTSYAWSWYELARRYDMTEREVRKVFHDFKTGKFTESTDDANKTDDTNDDLEEWMSVIYASNEQMGIEMYVNYRDALNA